MLKKSKKGYYYLESFAKQKGIIHGFSSREDGDCNPQMTPQKTWPNVEKFLDILGLDRGNLILMEQVHDNRIKVVGQNDCGKIIPGADGLISDCKEIILGVNAADCPMIIFYDSSRKLIGVVHAGWKGLFKKIPEKMVDLMIKLGGLPENILVGVGPYAGGCSYEVDQKFVDRFYNVFGLVKDMVNHRNGKPYFDLGVLLKTQLVNAGIKGGNIEFPQACTVCRNEEFFSFRKDHPGDHGRMLGVIALIN